jgi:LPXTG-motif cell wall-anchored protein
MKFKILFIFLLLLLPAFSTHGASNQNEIDLTTNPDKVLFDISNLKPGDSIERRITVLNNGKKDFKYIITNNFFGSSEKFYQLLYLKVLTEKKILFNGRLEEFQKLKSGYLKSHSKEDLVFLISIPKELGNEYQGLHTEAQFKFYVEGTLGGILPANGPKLPETGTNMFNYILAGSALLIIGLVTQYLLKRKKSDSIM